MSSTTASRVGTKGAAAAASAAAANAAAMAAEIEQAAAKAQQAAHEEHQKALVVQQAGEIGTDPDLLFKMLKTLNAEEQKQWEDTGIDRHKEIFGKWLALQASA